MSDFGTKTTIVNGEIALNSISPEAHDFLNTIMDEWYKHEAKVKENIADYEPTPYGAFYWLVRWSDLVRPKNEGVDVNAENIGDVLHQLRVTSGMSQQDMSELLGFKSAATISHYEQGKRKIDIKTLSKVADALGCSLSIRLERAQP